MLNSLISAGMEGIKNGLDPGDEVRQDLFALSDEEIEELGIETLPSDLHEALDALAKDAFIKETLSESYPYYIAEKKKEILDFNKVITNWEMETYLEY